MASCRFMADGTLPPDTILLATVEAADAIGVERSTLSRWIESGRIAAAHKLPGKNGAHLFALAEVERVRDEYAAERKAAS